MSEMTNAQMSEILGMRRQSETFAEDFISLRHAADVLSAPGVVDLDPAHTAEILTWALRIATAYVDKFEGSPLVAFERTQTLLHLMDACPPHVVEALRKVTT